MTHLPLVSLANTVQRVAGYQAFNREICSYTSPASIIALPRDARTLYETVTAPQDTKSFSFFDRNDRPISGMA